MRLVAQQLEQALAPAFALGDASARGAASLRCGPAARVSGSGGAAVDADVGQRRAPSRARVVAAARAAPSVRMPAAARAKNSSARRNSASGRQDRPLRVVLQEAVALARVGPEALQRRVELAVQHQRRLRRRGSRRSSRSASKNSGR